MQYAVPQFVEVEDKVIGPLTVRQFLILLAGGGLTFLAYRLADLTLFILLALVIMGSAVAFAFIKINGQPIHQYGLNAYKFLTKPKILMWAHDPKLARAKATEKVKIARPEIEEAVPTKEIVPRSKLRDLSVILDTYTEGVEREEKKEGKERKEK